MILRHVPSSNNEAAVHKFDFALYFLTGFSCLELSLLPVPSLESHITTAKTDREIRNVTKFEVTFAIGYIYLGTYTFLITEPLFLIERIALLVD